MDFMKLLEEFYSSPENTRNPLSKKELLRMVPGLIYHRTIIGDETLSVPKQTKFTNIPPTLRLTTFCVITCSLRRKCRFTVDMFISEIIYGNSRLFRRHFYHVGILLQSPKIEDCTHAMTEMELVWPDRRNGNVVDVVPKFKFNCPTPPRFKDCFLAGNDTKESSDIEDLARYVEGLPCLLAPREPTLDWKPRDGILWADMLDE